MNDQSLSQFSYNPNTGILFRNGKPIKVTPRRTDGYACIRHARKTHLLHRFIWLVVTGDWPKGEIDHRNRVKTDNRWENLRDTDRSTNQLNTGIRKDNTSGVKGVSWDESHKKWAVSYCGQYLGQYDTIFDAAAARIRCE